MAFVCDYYIPFCIPELPFWICAPSEPVKRCDDTPVVPLPPKSGQRIFLLIQSAVGKYAELIQTHVLELVYNVRYQTPRCNVENAQIRVGGLQAFQQDPNLNCLSKTYLIRNEHSPWCIRPTEILNEARLMAELQNG